MKARARKSFLVTIELSEYEAKWLLGMVQNSLSDEESEVDCEIREEIWNALTEAGVKI